MISVILPVWKPNIDQLKLCVDSIVNQTYNDLEIIIIYRKTQEFDDKFYALISRYNDNRIKIVENKRSGFTNSLNEGIKNSSGEFIARIDADDYCETNRFERQLEFKEKNEYNIVGSWAYSISDDGKVIGKIEPPITHSEIRKKIMFHCPMLHPTILMDRKVIDEIGAYDESFVHAEDYEFYFRAMSKNYRFGNVQEYLTYIREATESRSRGSEWKKQRSYYVKAKNRAFFEYGFVRPRDVIYHMLTPAAYFMAPRIWSKMQKLTGWNKKHAVTS